MRMTAMLRGRRAGGHGGMLSICWTCFLWFHMAATTSIPTVPSFKIVTATSFPISLVMMQGNLNIPIFSG